MFWCCVEKIYDEWIFQNCLVEINLRLSKGSIKSAMHEVLWRVPLFLAIGFFHASTSLAVQGCSAFRFLNSQLGST